MCVVVACCACCAGRRVDHVSAGGAFCLTRSDSTLRSDRTITPTKGMVEQQTRRVCSIYCPSPFCSLFPLFCCPFPLLLVWCRVGWFAIISLLLVRRIHHQRRRHTDRNTRKGKTKTPPEQKRKGGTRRVCVIASDGARRLIVASPLVPVSAATMRSAPHRR